MGIDEQDREAGRLQREKVLKNRELACLLSKQRRFTSSIKQLCTWMESEIELIKGSRNPKQLGATGKDPMEWMEMEEVVQMNHDIRELRVEIQSIEKSLADMGYA